MVLFQYRRNKFLSHRLKKCKTSTAPSSSSSIYNLYCVGRDVKHCTIQSNHRHLWNTFKTTVCPHSVWIKSLTNNTDTLPCGAAYHVQGEVWPCWEVSHCCPSGLQGTLAQSSCHCCPNCPQVCCACGPSPTPLSSHHGRTSQSATNNVRYPTKNKQQQGQDDGEGQGVETHCYIDNPFNHLIIGPQGQTCPPCYTDNPFT